MSKVTREVFYEWIKKTTVNFDDSKKNETYEELLETGSVTLEIDYNNAIILSIVNGFEASFDYNHIGIDDSENLKEIDDIVNSDIDDDPIDFYKLEHETDDVRELTNQELMEIGIIPSTQEKMTIDDLISDIELNIENENHWLIGTTDEGKIKYHEKILTREYFLLTIVKFYKDKVRLQASDGESK